MSEDGCEQPGERRPGDWVRARQEPPCSPQAFFTLKVSKKHHAKGNFVLKPEMSLPIPELYKGRVS